METVAAEKPTSPERPEGVPAPLAPPTAAPAEVVVPSVPGGRRYSTLVIFYPQHDADALEPATKEIRSILEAEGAAIIAVEPMGRKTLAYKIGKQTEGVYVHFVYSAPPRAISAIERDLGHKESVLRFLTVSDEPRATAGHTSVGAKA